MPVPTELTVKASEVRKGDTLCTPTTAEIVTDIDRKVKWTHIGLADGRVINSKVDADVTVVRQVRTDAEKRQENLDFFHRDVEQGILHATEGITAVAAKMTEYAQYRHDSQWSALDAYAKAVCANEIWQNVALTYKNLGDWVAAVNAVAAEYREAVLGNYYRANSTSWTSNGMAEQMRESVCQWLRSYTVHSAAKLAESEIL